MIKYRAFIKVAELGNISRAAKALGYSQPGVSHMLEALEEEIGVPLLIRGKKQMLLTDDGKRILECCRQIVHDHDVMLEISESMRGLSSGELRIASLNSMLVDLVPALVDRYASVYSNINIYLHEFFTTEEITDALKNGKVDVGFIPENVPDGFEFIHLLDDPVCIAANENHPFAKMKKVPVNALNGCNIIMPTPGWNDLVQQIHDTYGFSATTKYYIGSDTAGISMVEHDFGVYMISSLQKTLLPANCVAKEFKEGFYRPLGLCVRSLDYVKPSLQAFVESTKDYFTKLDPGSYLPPGSMKNGIVIY